MAKANKKTTFARETRVVERVIKVEESVPVERETYTLTLTKDEAEVLMVACSRMGGSPDGSRGVFDGKPDSILTVLSAQLEMDYQDSVYNKAISPPVSLWWDD